VLIKKFDDKKFGAAKLDTTVRNERTTTNTRSVSDFAVVAVW
jgi:tRNA A-37 threonylcarbamoyl transferase component Bud32